jgi:glycerol uptake facilitator-like aquaporin
VSGIDPRKLLAEFVGTMLLLTAVIGSGIMAERLAAGNDAVALLANTVATVFALFVLIEVFGPISGAHFNPVVTLIFRRAAALSAVGVLFYILAQLAGAAVGAMLANVMFDLPAIQWAAKARGGVGQWIAEVVATAGLVLVIARAEAGRAAALTPPTSARRTGSRPRHRSPTRQLPSGGCSATRSPASRRPRSWRSWRPSCAAA